MRIMSGVDTVEIKRIKKSLENTSFLERVYGKKEIQYFKEHNMPLNTIAAAFCAKEAFGKAIGTGITGFNLNEVQTLHNEKGKPYLELSGSAKKLALEENFEFDISITHTKEYATAVVIAYSL